MKSKYIIGALAVVAAATMTSCEDFLNDNRYPLSSQTVNPVFWSNSSNVQNQVNTFYNDYYGYGNGASTNGTFYYSWLSDDQCGRHSFNDWTFKAVPPSDGSYSDPYVEIRRANQVIAGVEGSTLSENEKNNFIGLARLHRARQYYHLVQRFGDVILAEATVDVDDSDVLFGKRTNRNAVMDFVLEDLNFAVANIAAQSGKTEFSKDMAQAFKLEVCLFEGAFAKYHQNDNNRAKAYFTEAEKAGLAVAGKYPICDSYASLYNSLNYDGLAGNDEIIMYKGYENTVFMNSITDYSNASDGVAGITRDAFNAFLFRDGKNATTTPATSYPTTDAGVAEGTTALSIQNLLDVRDGRLSAITYPNVAYVNLPWAAPNTGGMVSSTGYGVRKFNNYDMPFSDVNSINHNYCSAPLFWGARVCVGLLEAKAELTELGGNNLSDADLNAYMKPLWKRANFDQAAIDGLTVAYLKGLNDTANNMGVSSLIWEIRRLRRCELMLDDGIRYWDLVRWHQLELLDTNRYPNTILGANVVNAPIKPDASAMTGNYVNGSFGGSREWNNRYYFYPIPSGQIALNPELTQNPGW